MRRPPEADRPASPRRVRSQCRACEGLKHIVQQRSGLLEWVDFYLDQDWPLFPLHSIKHGACTCTRGSKCSASNAGKHPRNRNGFHGASTSGRLIRNWLRQCPSLNLGIATGGAACLVVIDIDPRHGGDSTQAALEKRYGKLPKTFTVTTGGGGLHLYFSMYGIDPPIGSSAGRLGPGVDAPGEGGSVGTPSVTLTGASQHIEWTSISFDSADWVVDQLQDPTGETALLAGIDYPRLRRPEPTEQPPRDLNEAVIKMLAGARRDPNSTLNGVAYWAGRRVAGDYSTRGMWSTD